MLKRFLLIVIASLVVGSYSFANDTDELIKNQKDLDKIQVEKSNQIKLKKKIKQEINRLQTLTKNIAKQSQEYEKQLSLLEQNISSLNEEYDTKLAQLRIQTKKLASIILTAQKISNHPETSIFLYPGSSKKAVQSTFILKMLLKDIEKTRTSVQNNLADLEEMQKALSVKQDGFLQKQKQLAKNNKKLKYELGNKKLLEQKSNKKISSLEEKSKKLSKKIKNIKDFLEKVEAERRKRNKQRLNKPVSIKKFPRSGRISSPVSGKITKSFNSKTVSGKKHTGITIQARGGAMVIAPFDGYIAYADKFKQLGNVVIISHEGGYNSVLIGLNEIYAKKGTWVLTDEPIGSLPKGNPKLQYEIRYGTKALNPLRWVDKKMLRR